MIRLTPSQETVVNHKDGAILVVAGPGSGKTRVLTERIRTLLEQDEGALSCFGFDFHQQSCQRNVRAS